MGAPHALENNMEKVIIFGASGHAKVIIESILLSKEYEIAGLIDSYKPKGQKLLGYEILGKEDLVQNLFDQGITKGVIAIGDNWQRMKMYERIIEIAPGFEFITVVHPSAIISPFSKIGKGTVILSSATINTDANIGDFCIINTDANFGHDGILGDFSSLAPGVTTGGNVTIGKCSAISLGTSIIQGVRIGDHSLVGACSLLLHDVKDLVLVYGQPAKEIRTIEKGEDYLHKT